MVYKKNRAKLLRKFGATPREVNELMAYNENYFKKLPLSRLVSLPMEDEPFVSTWIDYKKQAEIEGVFNVLKAKLVQLQFPVEKGISNSENYKAATRRGVSTEEMPEAQGLCLEKQEELQLLIEQTPAGKIPILIVRERNDFIRLVQALTMKNEPSYVADAVGAVMVSGYNNWDRIWAYKRDWESRQIFGDWQIKFRKLVANKERYQDRFIILSDGPYSDVLASDLHLSEDEWSELSLVIRREHEMTHYFTQRLLGSMRNNMLDELIADYIGIISAIGEYKTDWFLRFVGLENYPICRDDGRIHRYRSTLSKGAFLILQKLVVQAADHLEKLNDHLNKKTFSNKEKAHIIQILSLFTLEELASDEGLERLGKAYSVAFT